MGAELKACTVQRLWDAGFGVTDLAPGPCDCGHETGDHVLEALGSPVDGGVMSCPDPGCECSGTWDTSMPEWQKAQYREGEGEESP